MYRVGVRYSRLTRAENTKAQTKWVLHAFSASARGSAPGLLGSRFLNTGAAGSCEIRRQSNGLMRRQIDGEFRRRRGRRGGDGPQPFRTVACAGGAVLTRLLYFT